MVNVGCINRVNTRTSVAITVVASSSARRTEESHNGRTNGYENSNKKLLKGFIFHILKFFQRLQTKKVAHARACRVQW